MITLSNYKNIVTEKIVSSFPVELKENHKMFLELSELIESDKSVLEDQKIKTEVVEHIKEVNRIMYDVPDNVPFEVEKNGQKVEIDEAKVERDLVNLCFSPNPRPSKIGDLVRKNTLTNQVQKPENNIYTELEQDIIDQRNNQSRLSVRDICRKNKCLYWDYRQAFNLLVEKKVIDPNKIYPIKFGRPKKKL